VQAKLLIDEDLSPSVAQAIRADGFDACHVRDRKMLGDKDHRVLDKAFEEDRIVVTANVDDFVKLARKRDLHAGMVLIEDGGLHRAQQLAVVSAAVAFMQDQDMANRVLWVRLDGTMEFEDIPSEP
jgi:predicted nuclease of predicted toxin-antitoxin system